MAQRIHITSDDTIIEFVRSYKTKDGYNHVYKYVQAKYHLGKEIEFSTDDLIKQSQNYFKYLKDEVRSDTDK